MIADDMLTIAAAATYLKVSTRKIARLIVAGDLIAVTNKLDNRERLIAKSQLDALRPVGKIIRQEDAEQTVTDQELLAISSE